MGAQARSGHNSAFLPDFPTGHNFDGGHNPDGHYIQLFFVFFLMCEGVQNTRSA